LATSALVVVAVGAVAWAVTENTRRSFEALDQQRSGALVAQFRGEFARRGAEVALRVKGIADAEATLRMAIELSRPEPDYALYFNDAKGLSRAHQLDFLELVAPDGTILSSAHFEARFGYPNAWVTQIDDWSAEPPFLRAEELPDGRVALGLMAVRSVSVGDKKLYVIGGLQLDREFLADLVLPEGMRVLLYRNVVPEFRPAELTDAKGAVSGAETLAPLIETVRRQPKATAETVQWSSDAASAETFHVLPLAGRDAELLGVLLVGSSRRQLVELTRAIRNTALLVGAIGIVLGIALGGWVAARVTRPVEQLAAGARQVAAGNWGARVEVKSSGEVGELAAAFNQMTQQLTQQRERLVQAERVAAWRELARRLAHELKNPLFPLQLTVENLERAREQRPEQFEEVLRESCATLLAELDNLKAIVGQFSDFAKMPAPDLQPVDVNEVVRGAVKLFEAQFSAVGRPLITTEMYLDENLGTVPADAELLRRALQNLVLNAMDAMPAGGTLTLRTERIAGDARSGVRLEVQDTGTGLTREECERLFTPYYTSKQHGTGLGLAIVQSVVSDHNARIRVASEPGMGTRFVIELPGPVTERAKLETRNSKIEAGETAAPGEEQVQEPPSERGGEISSEKKDGGESAPADH
jgi:signal transduction histidine kinase